MVQSMRLDGSAGLQYRPDAGEVCSHTSEGIYLPERAGTIRQASILPFSFSFIHPSIRAITQIKISGLMLYPPTTEYLNLRKYSQFK